MRRDNWKRGEIIGEETNSWGGEKEKSCFFKKCYLSFLFICLGYYKSYFQKLKPKAKTTRLLNWRMKIHKFVLICVATMIMLLLLVFSRTLSIIPNCVATMNLDLVDRNLQKWKRKRCLKWKICKNFTMAMLFSSNFESRVRQCEHGDNWYLLQIHTWYRLLTTVSYIMHHIKRGKK